LRAARPAAPAVYAVYDQFAEIAFQRLQTVDSAGICLCSSLTTNDERQTMNDE